jgi:hypothetical protein
MNKLYRLHFSAPYPITPEDVWVVAYKFMDGYTLHTAQGVWKGEQEPSYILEYLGQDSDLPKMQELAVRLRDRFDQSAVLLVHFDAKGELI